MFIMWLLVKLSNSYGYIRFSDYMLMACFSCAIFFGFVAIFNGIHALKTDASGTKKAVSIVLAIIAVPYMLWYCNFTLQVNSIPTHNGYHFYTSVREDPGGNGRGWTFYEELNDKIERGWAPPIAFEEPYR